MQENSKPKTGAQPASAAVRIPKPAPGTPVLTVRLNKRMAELGMCSRREADDWIARGWVRVNGVPAVMGQPVAA
ncbi:MAG: S4 domain-containing protein, partial [Polaromonas sp.]